MMEMPIIQRITSQKCVGYRFQGNRSTSIIENEGIDANGVKWRWRQDTHYDQNGRGTIGSGYMWTKLGKTPPASPAG